ncbi:MAG: squalene/phytoene synthase family protein [Anaerolineales bacterium]
MDAKHNIDQSLAAEITKSASKQTYYTIRLFVDRELVNVAYQAYGYFRWVDDILDSHAGTRAEKITFVNRQKDLLEACYRGEAPKDLCIEEYMLAELVRSDSGKNPGLQSYLRNMMAVMMFDAERCGRRISEAELSEYTRALATSVTDAMYYFIGHNEPAPRHEARYLAVTAAHITHMLRDTLEDNETGYFNIPGEYLRMHGISPRDVKSQVYQDWICSRVKLARTYFEDGRRTLAQVKNWRCCFVGYAYSARFEWMLRAIERDNYCLRSEYRERKSLLTGLWMSWTTLASMFASPWIKAKQRNPAAQTVRVKES